MRVQCVDCRRTFERKKHETLCPKCRAIVERGGEDASVSMSTDIAIGPYVSRFGALPRGGIVKLSDVPIELPACLGRKRAVELMNELFGCGD